MNAQASVLFNIASSFGGDNAEKVELYSPHSHPSFQLKASLYAAWARRIHTRDEFESIGRELAATARYAFFARRTDTVQQASQLMGGLPLSPELKTVARYYQAICEWRRCPAGSSSPSLATIAE